MDSSRYYLDLAGEHIEKWGTDSARAYYHFIMGNYYYEESLYEKSERAFNKGIGYAPYATPQNKYLLSDIYRTIGLVKIQLGHYDEGIEYLHLAENEERQTGNLVGLTWTLKSLANTFSNISLTPKAKENYLTALRIADSTGLNGVKGVILSSMPYSIFGKETISNRKEALRIFTELRDSFAINMTQLRLSMGFIEENQTDSALWYLTHVKEERKVRNGHLFDSYIQYSIGCVYLTMKDTETAEAYLLDSYASYQALNRVHFNGVNITAALAEVYKRKGNLAKAMHYTQEHLNLKEELDRQNARQRVEFKEFQQTLRDQQAQLALAAKNKELLEAKVQTKELSLALLSIALGSMLIVALVIFFFLRQKSRHAAVLENKNRKIEILIRELNHRVKNNFQVLSGIFSLQKNSEEYSDPLKLMNEGKNRIDAFLLLHQRLSFDNNEMDADITEYIDDLLNNLAFQFGFDRSVIRKNFHLNNRRVDSEMLIPLGLIVNELVTNAFKYVIPEAEAPEIQVNLTEVNEDTLELIVKDNGVSQSELDQSKSFGLRLVHSFAIDMKAQLSHRIDKGLMWTLKFNRNVARNALRTGLG